MEKAEYIKQLKILIKKYHPDLCGDKKLEPVYREITVKLNQLLNRVKNDNQAKIDEGALKAAVNGSAGGGALITVKDPAYAYYRLAIQYYRNIHPDQFYRRTTRTTYKLKTYKEQIQVLNKIFLSFNLSAYYFRKILTEYPESQWKGDAETKLQLLKKLYKSYTAKEAEASSRIIHTENFVQQMGLRPMF
jgi:hypothetical protein